MELKWDLDAWIPWWPGKYLAAHWMYTANSYSINHPQDTVTTWWLDSDSVVTVDDCWHRGDWAANGSTSVFTVLLAVNNGDCTVIVQSSCSHCVLWVTDWIRVLLCKCDVWAHLCLTCTTQVSLDCRVTRVNGEEILLLMSMWSVEQLSIYLYTWLCRKLILYFRWCNCI